MAINKLPLARSARQQGLSFNSADLEAAKSMASTPEAANYLNRRVKTAVKAAGMTDGLRSILANVDDFAIKTNFAGDRPSAFTYRSEDDVKDDFANLQDNLAESALQSLIRHSNSSSPIVMGYAVNDASNLLRVYSQDGKLLDPEATAAMDTLFNACISTEDAPMLSENGVLYEAQGREKQRDAAGNFVKAQKEKIQETIEERFPRFIEHLETRLDDNSMPEIVVQEHRYPATEATRPVAAETQAQAPVPTETTAPQASGPSVETEAPTSPSAGSGMGG